jgi:hypothetical protein
MYRHSLAIDTIGARTKTDKIREYKEVKYNYTWGCFRRCSASFWATANCSKRNIKFTFFDCQFSYVHTSPPWICIGMDPSHPNNKLSLYHIESKTKGFSYTCQYRIDRRCLHKWNICYSQNYNYLEWKIIITFRAFRTDKYSSCVISGKWNGAKNELIDVFLLHVTGKDFGTCLLLHPVKKRNKVELSISITNEET